MKDLFAGIFSFTCCGFAAFLIARTAIAESKEIPLQPRPFVAEKRHCHVIYVGEHPKYVGAYVEVFTFGPSARRIGPLEIGDITKNLSEQQCDQPRVTYLRYGDRLPFTE